MGSCYTGGSKLIYYLHFTYIGVKTEEDEEFPNQILLNALQFY